MINSIEQLENGTVTDKIIEIKSIYKNGVTTVQPVRDPLSNWYKGIPRLSENDKRDLKFWADPDSKFVLKEGTLLDLNREEHRVIWSWLKYQPCLAMSYEECQSRPAAEFYVHLQNKEAQQSISRKKLKHKAEEYVMNDNASNYPLRVKLLGINMDGEDPVVIEDFLLGRAGSEPERVIKLYEDKKLSLRMLLLEAVEKRKIIIEPSGAYRYGTMFLGMTEESALDWMNSSENASVVRLLEEEVNPSYFKDVPKADYIPETTQENFDVYTNNEEADLTISSTSLTEKSPPSFKTMRKPAATKKKPVKKK